MDFGFSEDQRLLQQTLRDFLEAALPPERVRELWQTPSGRSPELWRELAGIGVPGLLVPEALGGLGMDELDFVLLLEETGRAALAEPLVQTAAVCAPLLATLGGELARLWLPKVACGEARLALGHPVQEFTLDAHVADLLLLAHGDELHALRPGDVALTSQPANDPSQRLFTLDWTPRDATRVAAGERARVLLSLSLDRGALASAAQLLGVADRLIQMGVDYACQRKQFGVPIGSFQALKHMLADRKVRLEYARSLVYRAAHSVARDTQARSADVSMAKIAAGDAACEAAKTALQVHGAIGYTWEQDLHVWMRRAWSLELAWGSGAWHRARVASALIDRKLPAQAFGFSAPA